MTYFHVGDRVRFKPGIEEPPPAGELLAIAESARGQTRALIAWDDGVETWWDLSQLRHEESNR